MLTAMDKKRLTKEVNKLDSNKISKKVKGAINSIISKSSSIEEITSKVASNYSDYLSYWSKIIGGGG